MGTGFSRQNRSESELGVADSLGYRRPLRGFSTNDGPASANRWWGDGFSNPGELERGMDRRLTEGDERRLPDLGLALKSIFGIWLVYISLITVRSLILEYPQFWQMLANRIVVVLVGALITFLIYLVLASGRKQSLSTTALVAAILCLPASLLFSAFNYFIFYIVSPLDSVNAQMSMTDWSATEKAARSILEVSASWYFLFAAWAALFVAISFARQLRLADRRAGALEREAQDAQLRALRYQINPHFLFNTLNSLSSLILSNRTEVAERMLMNLSTFFRATLSADPTADIPLDEEIRLQRLYLDIEQIRFPDRLNVEIEIVEALRDVRVPILILQPVVENAVKYGVARSRKPVTIRISAFEEAGRIHIKVRDDGETAALADEGETGTGVGLRNVCQRLRARYGSLAGCLYGADADGGYTVHMYMPISSGD